MKISETINDALINLGVLAPTEEATPQDHQFGLKTLNRIIDTYSIQNQMITYTECIEIPKPIEATCIHNKNNDNCVMLQSYWENPIEIGYYKDINMQAPSVIKELQFCDGSIQYPLKEMTENQLSCCDDNYGIPTRYHVQKMDENNIKIYFDKIPSANLSLKIFAKMPYIGKTNLGEDYNANDDIFWSMGFEKMLMYRLAVELAPSYGVEATQTLKNLLVESENIFTKSNHKPQILDLNKKWKRRRW